MYAHTVVQTLPSRAHPMNSPVTQSRSGKSAAKGRSGASSRRSEPRHVAFRRSGAARFRTESSALLQPRFAHFWGRYAVPGGIAVFWAWFGVVNWRPLLSFFQTSLAALFGI